MSNPTASPTPATRAILAAALLATLLAATPAAAQYLDLWCWEADEIHARVEEGALIVFHDAAVYNCCPDSFDYEVSLEETTIRVREIEILTMPCDCLCCFDLAATIEDLPPGVYQLEFSWYDYEGATWLAHWFEVTIPDAGQAQLPAVVETYNSGCLATQSVPEASIPGPDEPASPTWGRIKTLFEPTR
jgi:hypothetical protein